MIQIQRDAHRDQGNEKLRLENTPQIATKENRLFVVLPDDVDWRSPVARAGWLWYTGGAAQLRKAEGSIMIRVHDGLIEMHTQNTSYILATGQGGLAENLHYGAKMRVHGAGEALRAKVAVGFGGDVLRPGDTVSPGAMRLELSPTQRGDFREGALLAKLPHGGFSADFTYKTATHGQGPAPGGGMPQGRGAGETLCLSFAGTGGLEVELFYSLFYDTDVIAKKMRLTNRGGEAIELRRCFSTQLDLPGCDYTLTTLNGAWGRECMPEKRALAPGVAAFGSTSGHSGNRCNPFFMLARGEACETAGEVYGFNLVYSGSHRGSVEVDGFGRTRVMQGLSDEAFSWTLNPGESFITPEAVLSFSAEGYRGLSHNMHRFVRRHILPPRWATAPRPVLVNNWEGTYFNFTEGKLLRMARVAARLGVELFVLDDGWFGARNSENAGLGDYNVNRKKLPGGLASLARSVNALGMDFGLWFEPEMVNEDSDLYRAHPDWAIRTPGLSPAKGRKQYALDLCRPEVREYIIRSVGGVLDSANIRYVKWDMNRDISDGYSPALHNQGEFGHRRVLGLYEVLDNICGAHEDILFEGCASGGNRFDLGMLYYMPQVWLSDDSDAHMRQKIQTGASFGYPQCVMGCHVSAVPNHQTLRNTPLDTRFNTAAFGLLGYELDMTALTAAQKGDIKAQIAFYKKHRRLLQQGDFYRLESPFDSAHGACRWMVAAPSRDAALVGDFEGLLWPNSTRPNMRLPGLNPDALYDIAVRAQKIDLDAFGGLINYVLPVHLNPDGMLVKTAAKVYRLDGEAESYQAYGSQLAAAGLARLQEFTGAGGYSPQLRFLTDFASRLYVLRRIGEKRAR